MKWDASAVLAGERWSPAEEEHLRAHYPTRRQSGEIAHDLRRTLNAVIKRAGKLGIRRPPRLPPTPKQLANAMRLRMARARNEKLAKAVRERWEDGARAIACEFGVSINTVAGVAWRNRVSWKTGPSAGTTETKNAGSSKQMTARTCYSRENRAAAACEYTAESG